MKTEIRNRRQTLELALDKKINVLDESYKVTWVGDDPNNDDDRELLELIEQERVFAEPFMGGLYISLKTTNY